MPAARNPGLSDYILVWRKRNRILLHNKPDSRTGVGNYLQFGKLLFWFASFSPVFGPIDWAPDGHEGVEPKLPTNHH